MIETEAVDINDGSYYPIEDNSPILDHIVYSEDPTEEIVIASEQVIGEIPENAPISQSVELDYHEDSPQELVKVERIECQTEFVSQIDKTDEIQAYSDTSATVSEADSGR